MLDASLDKPPQPTRLADYRPPDFLIDNVELEFDLGDTETRVKSHLTLRRNPDAKTPNVPLRLDGDELELVAIGIDGNRCPRRLSARTDGALVIRNPDAFALDIRRASILRAIPRCPALHVPAHLLHPMRARGLSPHHLFPRPPRCDVALAVTIRADKAASVPLSNGNPSGNAIWDGRHWAKWIDPPQALHLFALVAATLSPSVTNSRPAPWHRAARDLGAPRRMRTMRSRDGITEKAMRWDEGCRPRIRPRRFQHRRSAISTWSDGEQVPIVFNTRYAGCPTPRPTATTRGSRRSSPNEYFHNWTGNRGHLPRLVSAVVEGRADRVPGPAARPIRAAPRYCIGTSAPCARHSRGWAAAHPGSRRVICALTILHRDCV